MIFFFFTAQFLPVTDLRRDTATLKAEIDVGEITPLLRQNL